MNREFWRSLNLRRGRLGCTGQARRLHHNFQQIRRPPGFTRLLRWFVSAAIVGLSASALVRPADGLSNSQDLTLRNRHRAESHLRYDRHEFEKAAGEAEQALALSRQLCGPRHPDTIEDLRWLVQTEMDLGDFAAAHRHMRDLVSIREAVDQQRVWLINDARSYLRDIERVEQLGPDDLKRLGRSMDQIADAQRLEQIGKLDEAIEKADKGLSSRKEILGFSDGVYAEYLSVQGLRLLRAGKADRARRAFDESLDVCRVLYGQQHRQYAATLMAMSVGFRRADRLNEAQQALERATAVFRQVLGAEHETYRHAVEMRGEILEQLGEQAFHKGRLDAAVDAYRLRGRRLQPGLWERRFARPGRFVLWREYGRSARLGDSDKAKLLATMASVTQATDLVKKQKYDDALRAARARAAAIGRAAGRR